MATLDAPASAEVSMTISLDRPAKTVKERPAIVPLSLPAILQNPRQKLSHLNPPAARKAKAIKEGHPTPDGIVGKRRQRRAENALLSSNPHVLRPSARDLVPRPPPCVPTFSPRPSMFPSSLIIPPAIGASSELSNSGQFSFSLKGVRKALRRKGTQGTPRARRVVEIVETSLRSWLDDSPKRASDFHVRSSTNPWEGHILDHIPIASTSSSTSALEPEEPAIVELSRLPHALLWSIPDPFDRFIAHCTARYYQVVSFSKEDNSARGSSSNRRVTHFLRPHMVRPVAQGGPFGETPPGTDLSATEGETSAFETEEGSELGETESEWEEVEATSHLPSTSTGSLSLVDSLDTDDDEADADVGTEDEGTSELENSLADLGLARTTSNHPPTSILDPATPSRPPFFPVSPPSSTPKLTEALSGTSTPTPRPRRTRASFAPSSSRIREDATSGSRSRSRSRSPVRPLRPNFASPQAKNKNGWKIPERTFTEFLFA
ncbi:hypothetical protein T439DRAFT_326340 [Meredithblackwellia eburnea MCA 4105]